MFILYRLFVGSTYQRLGASFQISFSHPYSCVILVVLFLANSLCILFSVYSLFLVFLVLNSLRSSLSSHIIILLVFTAISNGSILFLTYEPRPFSSLFTLFSHPISPLLPFFLETQPRNHTSLLCYSLT